MKDLQSVSVRELLDSPEFSAVQLIGGERGLCREISRCNIFADEEILDWVSQSEILIMTEIHYKDWPEDKFLEFLRRCEALELAALAVKLSGLGIGIPAAAAAEADRLRLPLLLIPHNLSLAEFSSSVFRMIFLKQQDLLQRHKELNVSLQNCLLRKGSALSMLEILQAKLRVPLYLASDDFQDATLCRKEDDLAGELLLKDARLYLETRRNCRVSLETEVHVEGWRGWRCSVPIYNQERLFGQLIAWSEGCPIGRFGLLAMETVASGIALVFMQELALREVEIRHSSEFIAELLNENSRDLALNRAAIYQLNTHEDHAVLLLKFRLGKGEREAEDSKELYRILCQSRRWMERCLEQEKLRGLLAQRGDLLEVILSRDGKEDEAALRQRIRSFSEELIRNFQSRLRRTELLISAGVGRFYAGLASLEKSYQEAENALKLGASLFKRKILFFDELGIFRVLSQDAVQEEMLRFCHETLDSLIEYDRKKCTELLHTLSSYFRNNGNINKTSEALYTHYNTVLYRLERIREISGRELSDPNDRLNLELALKIREITAGDETEV